MASCNDVLGFLNQAASKSVTATLSDADAQLLTQLGLIQLVTADQYRQLQAEVQELGAKQAAISAETAQRMRLAQTLQVDHQRTHSILFHFQAKDKQSAETDQEGRDQQSLQAIDQDMTQRIREFNDLVGKRSLLDTLSPYGERFVGLTGLGVLQIRNIGLSLYRVGNADFQAYWNQAQRITQELTNLAMEGAAYFAQLQPGLTEADRSYLWAISIGLSKVEPNPAVGAQRFRHAYGAVYSLSPNTEDRLMAGEILFSLPRPLAEELPALSELVRGVRKQKVPAESALGVASILDFGRRADGTFATANLAQFLTETRSYDSAAMLAIMNQPMDELTQKFQRLRLMFRMWGYETSEDVELASAYLTVSELPADGISTKLAIIARGLRTYLAYPLVAAAILASVSTFEANETLNLLEQAYNLVGQRAMGMSQAELITLAVRMIHGIRNELVGTLDTTAPRPVAPPAPGVLYAPRVFFLPIIVAHGAYFSTFSGISGAHPGHVHGFGGGVGGFAG